MTLRCSRRSRPPRSRCAARRRGCRFCPPEVLAQCTALVVAADVNAVPPAGIEGLSVGDDGAELPGGALGIGALAIGGVKYKVQRGLLERMLGADHAVALDFPDAFDLAREVVRA